MEVKVKENRQKGFTLLELMVSVAIIAIISTIFLSNYGSGGRKSDLIMTAQMLASNIRVAQNNALSLKHFEGSMPAGGWGVVFNRDASEYVIFADVDGNTVCNNACDSTSNEDVSRIALASGIIISDTLGDGGSINRIQVNFLPPDPQISICRNNTGQCNYSVGQIVLGDSYNTIKININKFGLVEIEK